MKSRFTINRILPLVCIAFLLSFSTFAQQTKKISLQGFLKDANGKAVADGQQSITFKLYPVLSGGTAEWSEVQNINVFGGVYSTNLGTTANTVSGGVTDFGNLSWGSKTYFVGVTIQGTELSPRTELTFAPYSLGSPFAEVANTVRCSGAVGDVKYSILNPQQFAAQNGNCWVPMDGGSMSGSKLAAIIGGSNVPNAGGLFLRGQESQNGSTDNDPERSSGSTIAQVQDQAMQTHQHGFSGSTSSNDATTMSSLKYFYEVYTGDGGNLPGGVDGNSMEEGLGKPDRFMRFNTIDLRGNHGHSFSGTTASNNGFSAQETRPKNLNLWTYIRIN